MTWKWIGRIFPPAEAEPFWLAPDAPINRAELLLRLLEGLGGAFRERAAERIRAVVGALSTKERVRMDETLRRLLSDHYGWGVPNWIGGADDVRRLSLPAGTEGAVLGLLAGMPNGYVREAAVQRLALLGGGDELAPLLIRANDWAQPVRVRATDALRVRLRPDYAEHWVRALPFVLRLRNTGRGDAAPLVDDVLELLAAPGSREEVWKGLRSPDRGVSRACFRILLQVGRTVLERLVRAAQDSRDEVIRLEAARAATALDDGALHTLLPRMMADPLSRMRIVALPLAAARMGHVVLPAIRLALLDRSVAVRGEARGALDRLEPMDFADFYRARIGERAMRLAEAVAGLGETGTAEDADMVAELLDHPRTRVRIAALRALVRVAGDAAVPALTAAIGDASPAVARAAMVALRPRAAQVDAASLAAWYAASNEPHVRRNALSLLAMREKWDGIAWVLEACGDVDPAIRMDGVQHLHRWRQRFNRSFTRPTAEQQERIRAALSSAMDGLEPSTAVWLRFVGGITEVPRAAP